MLTEAGVGSGSASASSSSIMPYWPQKDGATLELGNEFRIVRKFSSGGGDDVEDSSGQQQHVTSTLEMTHLPSR